MKTWTETLTLAALAATLTLAGCAEDGPANMIEAAAPQTHLTDAEFADSLAAGRMPNVDWIGWNLEGRPLDRFPLELRTKEEIQAEYRERGRRLPNGNYLPLGLAVTTREEADLQAAKELVVRNLQPPACPFFPCVASPTGEEYLREAAERMGLPYRFPVEHVEADAFPFTLADYQEMREWNEREQAERRRR